MIRTSARRAAVASVTTAVLATAAGTGTATAAEPDRPGVVRGGNTWLLRDALGSGPATTTFGYGSTTDFRHVTGDWDGNGTRTPGVVRQVGGNWVWYLRNSNSTGPADIAPFAYGKPDDGPLYDQPLVGDWDGDGRDGVGVVRNHVDGVHTPLFLLRNATTGGAAQLDFGFAFGDHSGIVVGDWDGNGTDTVGVVGSVPSVGRSYWWLRNANAAGIADASFGYGSAYDRPIAGDWDGDGRDGVGMIRAEAGRNRWLLRQTASAGSVQRSFFYGTAYDDDVVVWS